jgi:DNA-binding transcriptional MerR regulator
MTGHHSTDSDIRQEGIDRLLDHIRAGTPLGNIIELYEDLSFAEVEARAAQLVAERLPEERQELHFQLALLRSLRYSVASSKHCLRLGAINGVRELYEGQRLLFAEPEEAADE